MAQEQPAVLTFLMTDIEGSTRLWSQHEDAMEGVIARHDELITDAVEANNGKLVKAKGEGDSTFSVFLSPRDALVAAVEIQRALAGEPWPADIALRSRVALHSGEARYRDGDYHGTTVNRCARLRAIAHGGQIVVSQATADLVSDDLPKDVALRDLGVHGLRDLSRPERVFQAEHPDLDAEFPPLRSLGSTRSNLPAQRSSFVGRDEELKTVSAHLANNRVVTLTGVGGCGKTRLAVEAAAREVDGFDGVYFCDLSTVADPEVVTVEVAKAMGVFGAGPLVPSARSARDDLLDHLSSRRVLVVLDNCEHLIDAAASLVDQILDGCPDVTILATSREALEVDGERAYTVPSLPVPAEGETDSEAVRLFAERACAANATFTLTDENARHVAEICRRLDGIPLAIELAAAQSSALAPQQIEERLSDRFRLLSGGRRRVQRQQTLATMLDWSHDLLDDAERAVLRRLAVFPQPFTLEQAEGVVGDDTLGSVAGLLRSLLSKSLVISTGERYRLLETVRLYAEQKLLEAGEAEEFRTRHCDYFVRWIRSFDRDDNFRTPGGAALIISEMDHIRAAMRWCDEQDDLFGIAVLITHSWLSNVGAIEESKTWFERGAQADLPDDERLSFLTARAWNAVARVDIAELMTAASEAVTLPPDPSGFCHANSHGFLALAHSTAHYLFQAGDTELAREHITEALTAGKSVFARTSASMWTAVAQVGLGELEAARTTIQNAVGLGWERDTMTGALHSVLALVEDMLGNPKAAVDAMEESVTIFASDPWGIATEYNRFWTCPYGPALFAVGRETEAIAFMDDLVTHLIEVGAPAPFVPVTLGCLGNMLTVSGHYEDAVRLLIQGIEQPVSPIDHMVLSKYMDISKSTVSEERFNELCAEGRQLSLAEGSARAFELLRGA